MQEIKCIFCNKKSDDIIIKEDGFTCKKCNECGLVYLTPRPDCSQIIDIYKADKAQISAEDHITEEFIKRLFAKHHLKIIKKFIKSGDLLEIGPGGGYFLDEARKNGFDPYGIEINPRQARYIKNTLKIPCEDKELSLDSFSDKKFDIIYHCDILSHFNDPVTEFKKMNRKLRKDGYLVFETGILTNVNIKYLNLFPSFQLPDHLFIFSDNSLLKLLNNTGFALIKIFRYSLVAKLKVINIINKIRQRDIKTTNKKNTNFDGSHTFSSEHHSFKLRTILKKIYHYFLYASRYKIGYILPKRYVPITAITIAQKVSEEKNNFFI